MNITVITGTPVKGITYRLKEIFLSDLRKQHKITEYVLPNDFPHFCIGCKRCFLEGEEFCPHHTSLLPIRNTILEADLLVFAYPVYVLRAPGQVKALLDHLAFQWMVHRPMQEMFSKRALIITQSIGAPNSAAQRDVRTSLHWLGISSVRSLGFRLMEGIVWEELSDKRREKITKKLQSVAEDYADNATGKKNLKHRLLFFMSKKVHENSLKKGIRSHDADYWQDRGWIRR